MTMKKYICPIIIIILIVLFFLYIYFDNKNQIITPVKEIIQKPLNVYTFENLRKIKYNETEITIGDQIAETSKSVSRMFYFSAPQKPGGEKMLKVSGVINIPKEQGTYPVIIMFRGYIPNLSYAPGAGTQPSAQVMAQNGFITLAPDFLGFGESDKGSNDNFEDRFQKYTTAISLLSSLQNLNTALELNYSDLIRADLEKVGIWGHSNGGSIALTVLELTGVNYPTVLWAPVSKPFPYSILNYSDEYSDNGKAARKVVANFESLYDSEKFSQTNYFNWIKAPIEIHQGDIDEEVPFYWSKELLENLKENETEATLINYANSNHNFLPSGWNNSVRDTISFYNKYFKE